MTRDSPLPLTTLPPPCPLSPYHHHVPYHPTTLPSTTLPPYQPATCCFHCLGLSVTESTIPWVSEEGGRHGFQRVDSLSNIDCRAVNRPQLYDFQPKEYSDKNIKQTFRTEVCEAVLTGWSNLSHGERKEKDNTIYFIERKTLFTSKFYVASACLSVSVCLCMFVCMHVYMCVFVCMCVHV